MKNHPKNYWHSHKEIFQRHYTRASQGKDTGGGGKKCVRIQEMCAKSSTCFMLEELLFDQKNVNVKTHQYTVKIMKTFLRRSAAKMYTFN